MPYPTSRWKGSGNSAHMQRQIPLPWLRSGNTMNIQAPSHHRATPHKLPSLHLHSVFLQIFPNLVWGTATLPWVAAANPSFHLLLFPTAHYLQLYSHLSHSCFLAGPLPHQVSLSHICRVSKAKFHEGLQHNSHRDYQGKQWTFQSFCDWYHLTAFPASEDMLVVFTTYLDEHLQ